MAARQLGCAQANTRSLSVLALGAVRRLLEAERGNRGAERSPRVPLPLPVGFIISQRPPQSLQGLLRHLRIMDGWGRYRRPA